MPRYMKIRHGRGTINIGNSPPHIRLVSGSTPWPVTRSAYDKPQYGKKLDNSCTK